MGYGAFHLRGHFVVTPCYYHLIAVHNFCVMRWRGLGPAHSARVPKYITQTHHRNWH